jgi:hypothetical protein
MTTLLSREGDKEPSDPFLRAHWIAPFTYDLGGRFRPTAIRDQMLRARLLIDRAQEEGFFPTKKILVIGAGVAGVSAAARAARYGIFSVIVEQKRKAFERFSLCSSRWIHPAQYDWPAEHWERNQLDGFPLSYNPGWPSALAVQWQDVLESLKIKKIVDPVFDTSFSDNALKPGTIANIAARIGRSSVDQEFDLVIRCEGPGIEDCQVGSYRGMEFFQTDPFEEPAVGLPEGVTARVLISGGGDGALQDFIRIASGVRSAGELFRMLFPDGADALISRILNVEIQAQRQLLWSSSPRRPEHDHSIHYELETAYNNFLLAGIERTTWDSLRAKFKEIAGARLRDERILHVCHSCTHFSHCYPLNRFLALLVGSFLKSIDANRFRFLTNVATVSVEGTDHRCESPEECHGRDHWVRFDPLCCVGKPAQQIANPDSYNIVVVRHGVKLPLGSERQVRQMLPFQFAP